MAPEAEPDTGKSHKKAFDTGVVITKAGKQGTTQKNIKIKQETQHQTPK